MGSTEEQGAIVTLQSKEKPAVGMAGHLLLTPGVWDLACLGSQKAGVEEERVEGGGGGQVGPCGRSMDMAFPCWGKVQQVLLQPAQKELESTWHNAGNALCMDLSRAWTHPPVPRALTGTGRGLGVLRIVPPPFDLPDFAMLCPAGRG